MRDLNVSLIVQPQADLLGTPVVAQQMLDPLPVGSGNTRLALAQTALHRQLMGLFRAIASQAAVTPEFTADSRFVSPKYLGYLCLIVTCFHQRLDLVSFFLGKLRVHGAPLTLVGERSYLCYRILPSNQLCRVVLGN